MYGYCIKWAYDFHLLSIPALGEHKQADVVVSLTSYGRRVKEGVVCYSIYSILRQTIQPQRIIIWLSQDEWNEQNLPHKLKKIQSKGVEILFCEDMRSYKKLLPTLAISSDKDIITIDDDVIYPSQLINNLYKAHCIMPNAIIATHMHDPIKTTTHFMPYKQWTSATSCAKGLTLFPVGVGGVLYPAHSLKAEMLNYTTAQQYSPLADDVWFWAAGIAANTEKLRTKWTFDTISFDAIYQYIHRGSALQHSNVKGDGEVTNDTQIAVVLNYIKQQYGTDC